MQQSQHDPLAALIAAYREGLSLAAVAAIAGSGRIRIIAASGDGVPAASETVAARWWCRRLAEAQQIVATATARMRRIRHPDIDDLASARESIVKAATRLGIPLYSDQDITEQAMPVIARLDDEIEKQKQSGALKAVNSSYRNYRLAASGRGERVLPYARWMERYKTRLMREIAANLR
jgi:hypothetical protein